MYLLDSCICIDLMRGKLPYAYDLMRASDPKLFAVPAIVVAELSYGVEKSSNPERNRLLTERFLAPYEVIPFDNACALAYGTIRNQLRMEGCTIGPNDLFIAATAIARQATLVTNNVREFQRVRGLHVESWYEVELDEQAPSSDANLAKS